MKEQAIHEIGTVLSIPCGGYRHYGVWAGWDQVAHASKGFGRAIISTFEEFADGNDVENHGRWSKLSDSEILRRIHERLGRRYNLFRANCEQFVREVSDMLPWSPQIIFWGVVTGVAAWFLVQRARTA